MDNRENVSPNGRLELVTALENLCAAMNQLLRAAETRLTSQRRRESSAARQGLNFSSIDELPIETICRFEPSASLVPRLMLDSSSPGTGEALMLANSPSELSNEADRAFACRLVALQEKLGGFLKP